MYIKINYDKLYVVVIRVAGEFYSPRITSTPKNINWSHFNITLKLSLCTWKTLRQMLIAEWGQLLQNIPKHQILKSY